MPARCLLGAFAIAVLLAASPPPATNQPVYDCQGVLIGWVDIGTSSARYTDNPSTSHPPDQGQSWGINQSSGTWHANGHTVSWTDLGGGCWRWEKRDDATGELLDKGYLGCSGPPDISE